MEIIKKLWYTALLVLVLGITYSLGLPICDGGQWEKYDNLQIVGASDAETNVATAEDCKEICINDTNCVAVDYSTNPQEANNCQMFYSTTPVSELKIMSGIIHYTMVNCTGQTSPELEVSTATSEPESEGEPEITPEMVFTWIQNNPEYTAMIGMGVMIAMLFVTAICLICCLSGRNKE